MHILLDTHALLWMLHDDPRLPASARRHITNAAEIGYSIASLWEIALKLSNKGFDFRLADDWHEAIPQHLFQIGAKRFDIAPPHLRTLQKLPLHHRDPFDRMILAQAITEQYLVMSKDPQLKKYKIKVVW